MIRICNSHGRDNVIASLYNLHQACQLTHSSLE